MKNAITAQQLVHFRKEGHIRFENFPANFPPLQALGAEDKRDLWRRDPSLKKWILRTLAPIALELTGKKSLRLACDQWIDAKLTGKMKELFCFQGLAIICSLTQEFLDLYEPSSLASLLPIDSYLVAFGLENTQFVDNWRDPYVPQLKKMGYAFGDKLEAKFHPSIYKE
jgi:hypothetical protein